MKIEGDNEPQPTIPREEGHVPFVFVGTIESIANAKILLEYYLTHLKVSILSYKLYARDGFSILYIAFPKFDLRIYDLNIKIF